MNRDNMLFLLIGVLVGFIAGYLLEERMADIQPPLRVHGASEATGVPSSAGNPAGAPPAAGPGVGGGPAVAAVRQLQERVAQNPDDADAVLGLANANFDISNWGRAVELYQRYLELKPGDADVLSDLGICYRAQGDFSAAIGAFDEALAADPNHWLARFNKAIVLGIDQGNLDGAAAVVAEMRSMRPDAPDLQRLEAELERRRTAG